MSDRAWLEIGMGIESRDGNVERPGANTSVSGIRDGQHHITQSNNTNDWQNGLRVIANEQMDEREPVSSREEWS